MARLERRRLDGKNSPRWNPTQERLRRSDARRCYAHCDVKFVHVRWSRPTKIVKLSAYSALSLLSFILRQRQHKLKCCQMHCKI